jgi:hypothetical protein
MATEPQARAASASNSAILRRRKMPFFRLIPANARVPAKPEANGRTLIDVRGMCIISKHTYVFQNRERGTLS